MFYLSLAQELGKVNGFSLPASERQRPSEVQIHQASEPDPEYRGSSIKQAYADVQYQVTEFWLQNAELKDSVQGVMIR
ncbi:hypothetical protein N7509_012230 [Penicillium cosmopolitanum]|uniref:Uncharacterized protein n=1 Tax=Penicillium cosmopolitanum TaxID=1131564 RepID=A0A9W9SI84_9EURO|nr:uncharacterized protein N7509_012230 [Penicillium cosmopolitanum]KAJ5379111.1 hypothetical protein N7509_012230 [Penicillium cosmopolitanum]